MKFLRRDQNALRNASTTVVVAVVLILLVAAGSFAADVTEDPSLRYYRDASGKPVFLLGYYGWAAVPDGYYIDHPSQYSSMINQGGPYGVNYIRISLGVNRMTSSTNPTSWNGVATPVPFLYTGSPAKADLGQWDTTFWNGLKAQCALARTKGLIVHVSIFDGVELRDQGGAAYGYNNSFWNPNNHASTFYPAGSYGDCGGCFYRTSDFNGNTGIGFYQRKLIDKVCSELSTYDNVFFEIGNEMLSADSGWNIAVSNYIMSKTSKPVSMVGGSSSVNGLGSSDHAGDTPAAVRSLINSYVGHGYPAWIDPDGSLLSRAAYDTGANDNRRAAWYSFVGGAACFGGFTCDFWAYPINPPPGFNTAKATYYKNLQDFITTSGVKFWTMVPQHSLVSNSGVNSCLARTGTDYLAYILNDSSATINLTSVSGTAYYRVYDTKTGVFGSPGSVSGGAVRTFSKPTGADDWAIFVTTDTSSGSVTNFTAVGADGQVALSWTNPIGPSFTGTKILFKTTGYPSGATDGASIYDGNGTSTTHTGLTNGVLYYYTAFAHDAVPNYSAGAQAGATPAVVDTTAPSFGGSISPSVTNSLTPTITITAQDTGVGLNVSSAEFAYSVDGGTSFGTYVGRYVLHSKGTGSGGGNQYWYPDFYHPAYTIASGDHLQYDIYSSNADGTGAVDLEGSLANLRDSGILDQNGLSGHPNTNLYSRDYHQWYHRDFDLSSKAGQTITDYEMGHETDNGVSEFYVRNVIITNNGLVKDRAANADSWTAVSDTVAPGNNGFSSIVGPEMITGDPASPAACTGSNGTTAQQNVTVAFSSTAVLPLVVGANNRIKYHVSDVSANRAVSSTFTIMIDTTAPTVSARNPVSGSSVSSLPSVAVTFSEAVIGVTAASLTVNGSAATGVSGSVAGPYTFTGYAIPADGTVSVALAAGSIQDLAGNAFGGNSWTYSKSASSVTVTINQAAGQADPTKNSPINYTVVFSENVSGFATGDVSFTGSTAPGTLVGAVSGGPSIYNVAVSGMTGSGVVVATIGAGVCTSTSSGNANSTSSSTDNSVSFDNAAPTVAINQAAGQADPTSGLTVNFTAVFNESVTGFATGDVSFTGSTAPGTLVGTVSGGPSAYNVAVTGMSGAGTVVANIGAGVCKDPAGNDNAASTSTDNTVTVTQSVTIQRGTYGTVKDAYMRLDANPNDNFGNPLDPMGLRLYADSGYGSKGPRHNLIAFDLSSIAAGSTIISATFGEYYWPGTGSPAITGLKLSRVQPATTWVEGGGDTAATVFPWPTWNHREFGVTPWASAGATGAADIDLGATKTYDLSGAAGFRTVDVTNFLEGWVNGGWTNNGMLMWGGIDPANATAGYWLESCSENGTVANRPYLTVVYGAPPCNAPAITAQPVSLVKPAGANASFSISATGTGLTYQWKQGVSVIGGATSSSYSITPVASGDTGSYTCVVTGTCGTVTSTAAVLTVLTNDGSIATVKGLADNAPAQLGNKDLYLKWPGFAYIEEPTLFSGIRLQGALNAAEGDRICLVGYIIKPEGAEPYILVTTMTRADAATVTPVAASNFSAGCSLVDGLYVTVFGRVKSGSIVGNSYVITDGSDDTGIKIVTQSAPGVNEGQYVWVTGAAGYDGGRVVYKK